MSGTNKSMGVEEILDVNHLLNKIDKAVSKGVINNQKDYIGFVSEIEHEFKKHWAAYEKLLSENILIHRNDVKSVLSGVLRTKNVVEKLESMDFNDGKEFLKEIRNKISYNLNEEEKPIVSIVPESENEKEEKPKELPKLNKKEFIGNFVKQITKNNTVKSILNIKIFRELAGIKVDQEIFDVVKENILGENNSKIKNAHDLATWLYQNNRTIEDLEILIKSEIEALKEAQLGIDEQEEEFKITEEDIQKEPALDKDTVDNSTTSEMVKPELNQEIEATEAIEAPTEVITETVAETVTDVRFDFIEKKELREIAEKVCGEDKNMIKKLETIWKINNGELDFDDEKKKRIQSLLKNIIENYKKSPNTALILLKRLLNDKSLLSEEKLKTKIEREISKDNKEIYVAVKKLALGRKEIEEKITEMFKYLSIYINNYEGNKDYLDELQIDIINFIKFDIPKIYGLKNTIGKNRETVCNSLGELGLRDRREKLNILIKAVSKFDEDIEFVKSSEKKDEEVEEKNDKDDDNDDYTGGGFDTEIETVQETESDDLEIRDLSEGGDTEIRDLSEGESKKEETTTEVEIPKVETIEKTLEITNENISKIIKDVLEGGVVFDIEKDSASIAILKLIKEKSKDANFNLNELHSFLLKPNLILNSKDEKYDDVPVGQMQKLIGNQEKIIQKIKDKIDLLSRTLTKSSGDEAKKIRDEIILLQENRDLEVDTLDGMKLSLSYKNNTFRYKSTKQLLTMINIYFSKDKRFTEIDIIENTEKQLLDSKVLESEEITIGKVFRGFTGIFKPSLITTMESLYKDNELSKLGKEKLSLLAKNWNSKEGIETWISSIEGGEDMAIKKYLPKIIAYLEMSIRDGNNKNINHISLKKTETLLKNLKDIRINYVKKLLDGKVDRLKTDDISYMTMYFDELNKLTLSDSKINKKIIRRSKNIAITKNILSTAILGTAGVGLAGLGLLAGGIGIVGGGSAYGLYKLSKVPKTEENQLALKRGALRTLATASLAVGASLINPLLLPVALAGTFSPEIFKNRKGIKNGSKTAGVGLAKGAWLTTKFGFKLLAGVGLVAVSPFSKTARRKISSKLGFSSGA